jgi:hypothetical protein
VGDRPETHEASASEEPDPGLVELSELLVGTWRVEGQDIEGRAEYRSAKGGCLLVLDVDFMVSGSRMKVMQHIAHDPDTGTLRARYMDTMGDAATYTWVLDHPEIRVSRGDEDSDTYFRATLNEDNSQYVGTWHYPGGDPPDAAETIAYTRMQDAG